MLRHTQRLRSVLRQRHLRGGHLRAADADDHADLDANGHANRDAVHVVHYAARSRS
jgi:hypothetical protein